MEEPIMDIFLEAEINENVGVPNNEQKNNSSVVSGGETGDVI